MINLGYACINTELKAKKIFTNRTCRIKNFSLEKVSDLIKKNTLDLMRILTWNKHNGIHLFRVSSDMFPFYDHPELGYAIQDLKDKEEILENLNSAKRIAYNSDQRLTMHPGPYTVLSSENPEVRKKAVLTLNMHRDIMQLLGEPDPVINIHVGGNFSKERAKIFCEEVEKLPMSTRGMLSVENDDKPNAWSVRLLHQHIWYWTGIPIVLDTHHWKFCHEKNAIMRNDFITAKETWDRVGRQQKIHHSESAPGKRPQAHSDYIENKIDEIFDLYDVDCMIEAKMKEQAVLKYREKYAKDTEIS